MAQKWSFRTKSDLFGQHLGLDNRGTLRRFSTELNAIFRSWWKRTTEPTINQNDSFRRIRLMYLDRNSRRPVKGNETTTTTTRNSDANASWPQDCVHVSKVSSANTSREWGFGSVSTLSTQTRDFQQHNEDKRRLSSTIQAQNKCGLDKQHNRDCDC